MSNNPGVIFRHKLFLLVILLMLSGCNRVVDRVHTPYETVSEFQDLLRKEQFTESSVLLKHPLVFTNLAAWRDPGEVQPIYLDENAALEILKTWQQYLAGFAGMESSSSPHMESVAFFIQDSLSLDTLLHFDNGDTVTFGLTETEDKNWKIIWIDISPVL